MVRVRAVAAGLKADLVFLSTGDDVNILVDAGLIPRDYPHMDAVGFVWSDPYRWARASEVLASGARHSAKTNAIDCKPVAP